MKTEDQIKDEIKILQIILGDFIENRCDCGCSDDNINYYEIQIKTLKWVLSKD